MNKRRDRDKEFEQFLFWLCVGLTIVLCIGIWLLW